MRTYDHYAILSDDEHDEYVPAEVAQALYDSLVKTTHILDSMGDMSDYLISPKVWVNLDCEKEIGSAKSALSLADGETE